MYGPVRTVVWQGSAGDRRPYADQTAFGDLTPDWSLNTGQCHWRDQLAPSLPQSGLKLPFFFSFALALHADEARYAGNASLAGI